MRLNFTILVVGTLLILSGLHVAHGQTGYSCSAVFDLCSSTCSPNAGNCFNPDGVLVPYTNTDQSFANFVWACEPSAGSCNYNVKYVCNDNYYSAPLGALNPCDDMFQVCVLLDYLDSCA
jgi:hypothetical protein